MHQTTKAKVNKRQPTAEFSKTRRGVDRITEAEVMEGGTIQIDLGIRSVKSLGILQPNIISDLIKTSL